MASQRANTHKGMNFELSRRQYQLLTMDFADRMIFCKVRKFCWKAFEDAKAEISSVAFPSKLQLIWVARKDFRQICNACGRKCHNMDWWETCTSACLLSCWSTEEKPHKAVSRALWIFQTTAGFFKYQLMYLFFFFFFLQNCPPKFFSAQFNSYDS